MTHPVLSVCVPVFNETENLEPLIREIVAALEGRLVYEIVYANDGSTDGTLAALVALKAKYPQLRVVTQTRSGQSFAVRSAVQAAKGEWIATLDGDGQNDPADIMKLFERTQQGGVDLVGGLRLKRQDNLGKRISTKIGNGVRQFILRDGCRDTGCGLKIFRREAFLDIPSFAAMHRFLPALFQMRSYKTDFVPVGHRPRERGVSKYGNLQRGLIGLVDLAGIVWLRTRSRMPNAHEA